MPPEMIPCHCPYCGGELGRTMKEGRDRLYCKSCERIIWRNAEPVAAVIVLKGEDVLFIERGIEPAKGEWSLPAGFLEHEEEPEKAASRELEEETGLKTDPGDLDLVDAMNIERFPGQRLLATVYTIDIVETEGKLEAGDDAVEASFWNLEELREDEEQELRSHFVEVIECL